MSSSNSAKCKGLKVDFLGELKHDPIVSVLVERIISIWLHPSAGI